MRISDLIAMCIRNLTRRKLRTLLTVMGVVIGTGFIVVMISLGLGIERAQNQMLEAWGDLNVIQIHNFGNTETPLDEAAIAAIVAMPQVEAATPIGELRLEGASVFMQAGRRGRYEWGAWNIVGLYPQSLELLGYAVTQGELLTPSEVSSGPIRVLFGERTVYEFRDTRRRWPNDMINVWDVQPGQPLPDPFFDPMSERHLTLTLTPWDDGTTVEFEIEVAGIMQGDFRRGWETMGGMIIDLADMQRIVAEFERANNIRRDRNAVEGFDQARVRVYSIDDVAQVEAAIQAMGFPNTFSMEQERQNMQEGARQIQLILGFIGGIALFISALSIMNTMIMSVYERTREIGVMKVLGCALGDIRSVFLLEAALIGFIGGIIGNALSFLVGVLLNIYGSGMMGVGPMGGEPPPISVIPPWLMLLGLVFATCVGLVSGVVPAMRAVKISALEAIRTE